MRKSCLIFLMITLFVGAAFAQKQLDFGINAGMLTSVGAMKDRYDDGMEYSAYALLDAGLKPFKLAIGCNFVFLPDGKTDKINMFDAEWDTLSEVSVQYLKTNYTSYFLGLHIEERWFYFRPVLSLNYYKGDERGGIEVEGGLLIPLFDSLKLNLVSAKYQLFNLIGRSESEKYATFFQVGSGLLFSF